MRSTRTLRPPPRRGLRCLFTIVGCLLVSASGVAGQQTPRQAGPSSRAAKRPARGSDGNAAPSGTVPVLMLSDIHFDPFFDPARVEELRREPLERWPALLAQAPSPTQVEDFARLQKTCSARGVDTPYGLLSSALAQASTQQPSPLFVTVSGDLLMHGFDCRLKVLVPDISAQQISDFAAKTVAFVSAALHGAFPRSPVYLALGNNDSGCTDYREDRHSSFLQHVGETFAAATLDEGNARAIRGEFSAEGDYSIRLPAPMRASRLVVLQDIFETSRYESCGGLKEPSAPSQQVAWLRTQLADARAHHEHVWVMAHVPPGIDMYSTLSQRRKICTGEPPVMFLDSEKLVDALTAYSDVVTLSLFAHTHVDEFRLLHREETAGKEPGSAEGKGSAVAAKLVPSISPVNGNTPSFTEARVDPTSAELIDYSVFLVGKGKEAAREYTFSSTYKEPSLSAASLADLTGAFSRDNASTEPRSLAYQRFYFAGDTGLHAVSMQLFWRAYACSLTEDQAAAFRGCACPAKPDAPSER